MVWNSADKSADITLSLSDRVATRNAGALAWRALRATSSFATGSANKKYFEIENISEGATQSGILAGIATSGHLLTNFIGSSTLGYGLQANNASQRNFYHNGSPTVLTGIDPISVGQRMMVAVDFAASKLWVGTKGVWAGSGDPAAGTGQQASILGGTYFPAGSLQDSPVAIRLYADGAYAHTIPTGFSSWDADTQTTKIVTLRMLDRAGAPKANLAGLHWAFFDQGQPSNFSAPTAKGSVASTDSLGILSLNVVGTTLQPGAVGFLVVSNTDGLIGNSIAFAGPVVVTE